VVCRKGAGGRYRVRVDSEGFAEQVEEPGERAA
jgi:hypothetical protein